MNIDTEETKREKARQLKYKKTIVKDLNLETMIDNYIVHGYQYKVQVVESLWIRSSGKVTANVPSREIYKTF